MPLLLLTSISTTILGVISFMHLCCFMDWIKKFKGWENGNMKVLKIILHDFVIMIRDYFTGKWKFIFCCLLLDFIFFVCFYFNRICKFGGDRYLIILILCKIKKFLKSNIYCSQESRSFFPPRNSNFFAHSHLKL
jgi:hypothetical protein